MKLMTPTRFRHRRGEQGITILLVAVCMAFIVVAFAALAVDITALYTARAEARLAADAGALAGAKVLSVSGVTSDPTNTNLQTATIALARQVAIATASSNEVGGRQLLPAEVTVSIPVSASFTVNPQVTVTVKRTDLPAFFSKIWGTQALTVSGTAIAEAYNPSNAGTLGGGASTPPIAPMCVKPWILPNLDPTLTALTIFDPGTGQITSSGMVGKPIILTRACGTNGCNTGPPGPPAPAVGAYYDGAFTAPNTGTLPSSCTPACTYEQNIDACSPTPISCDTTSALNLTAIDLTQSCGNYVTGTANAISCLTHGALGGDTITVTGSPIVIPPVFTAGSGNPLVVNGVVNSGDAITTSSSIVTIPVVDPPATWPPAGYQMSVIGFLQVFINQPPDFTNGTVNGTILNISGCGKAPVRAGNPVLGDGVSPVPVRLAQN
jgi:hypothetical protein